MPRTLVDSHQTALSSGWLTIGVFFFFWFHYLTLPQMSEFQPRSRYLSGRIVLCGLDLKYPQIVFIWRPTHRTFKREQDLWEAGYKGRKFYHWAHALETDLQTSVTFSFLPSCHEGRNIALSRDSAMMVCLMRA